MEAHLDKIPFMAKIDFSKNKIVFFVRKNIFKKKKLLMFEIVHFRNVGKPNLKGDFIKKFVTNYVYFCPSPRLENFPDSHYCLFLFEILSILTLLEFYLFFYNVFGVFEHQNPIQ